MHLQPPEFRQRFWKHTLEKGGSLTNGFGESGYLHIEERNLSQSPQKSNSNGLKILILDIRPQTETCLCFIIYKVIWMLKY